MGSFSIWHWLIVLALIGLVAWLVSKRRQTVPGTLVQPKGIGGWLALLAVGQVIGVIRTLATFSQNMEGYDQIRGIPNGQVAIYAETGLNLLLLLVTVATTYALFAKKTFFPRLFLIQWLLSPVVLVADMLVISALFNLPVSQISEVGEIGRTFGVFLAGAIWVWYTQVSVRVRNTMVN